MHFRATIPYGAYWSTPFAKWQGSFSHLHAIKFAATVAARELAARNLASLPFDFGVLGTTIPQKHSFYGMPWLMGLIGHPSVTGPTISQACATGVRCLLTAASELEQGLGDVGLVIACDRTSNGPHLAYPDSSAPGGTCDHENWVLDNFNCDPLGSHAMILTAENVAAKHNISMQEQHDVVLRRVEQYSEATANGHAFQRRFMTFPFLIPDGRQSKLKLVAGDEGVILSTPTGLAKLKPVLASGTVTYGAQTHPADGSAALIVTTEDKAKEFSKDRGIAIRLLGFGSSRVDLAYMPEAPTAAAKAALDQAGYSIDKIDAIKSHNPFAINDILFSRATGAKIDLMNNYGCSLIWGHPQGPTGIRSIIELIEELVVRGGGIGLFQGCAAGDTAMAVVLEVNSRSA